MYSRVASSFICCCDTPAFSKIALSSASFLLVSQPTWAKWTKSVGVEISALVSFRMNFFLSRRCSNANVLTGAADSGCPVPARIPIEIHVVAHLTNSPHQMFHTDTYRLAHALVVQQLYHYTHCHFELARIFCYYDVAWIDSKRLLWPFWKTHLPQHRMRSSVQPYIPFAIEIK